MLERPWIVEENDAKRTRHPRMARADALEMPHAVAEREVHPDDLHRTRLGFDDGRVVDEEADTVLRHRARDDGGRLVIVVAVAGEDLSGEQPERLECAEYQVRIALRLHREEVTGQEHQVGLGSHRALRDTTETGDGHE